MTETYTVVVLPTDNGHMLVAVAPDGCDIEAEIQDEEERAAVTFARDELRVFEGCILTDEIDPDDEVVYSGSYFGVLTDDSGRRYSAAVQRRPRTA